MCLGLTFFFQKGFESAVLNFCSNKTWQKEKKLFDTSVKYKPERKERTMETKVKIFLPITKSLLKKYLLEKLKLRHMRLKMRLEKGF